MLSIRLIGINTKIKANFNSTKQNTLNFQNMSFTLTIRQLKLGIRGVSTDLQISLKIQHRVQFSIMWYSTMH